MNPNHSREAYSKCGRLKRKFRILKNYSHKLKLWNFKNHQTFKTCRRCRRIFYLTAARSQTCLACRPFVQKLFDRQRFAKNYANADYREKKRKQAKEKAKRLAGSYVRSILRSECGPHATLGARDFPSELVEAKRQVIMLRRKIREVKHT